MSAEVEETNFNASQAIQVYSKGTKAWFPDKEEGWISASCTTNCIENDKVVITFEDDNDGKKHVFESTITAINKANGSMLPPLRNPPKMEYTDDLTNLSYLNEPAGKTTKYVTSNQIVQQPIKICHYFISIKYYKNKIYAAFDLHLLWNCIDCRKPF